MRYILSFLIVFLLNIGLSCGQGEWILLKDNLQITDSIEKADIKVKFLHDSTDFRVYHVIDINNACDNYESNGYLYTSNLDSKSGQLVLYYENSQKKLKGKFVNGQKDGLWIEFHQNNQIDSEVLFVNGKKNGTSNWYFENGQISSKKTYLMDSLISIEMWDSTGKIIENPESADRPAMFKADDKYAIEFRNHISRNFKLPKELEFTEERFSGKIFVQFCIDKNGNLINEKVIKGLSESLDEEALRVIRIQRKWIPAIHHNRPKAVEYTIPIAITLI